MQIPPGAAQATYSISVLGRADATKYRLTLVTHGYKGTPEQYHYQNNVFLTRDSEPTPMKSGETVVASTPVLQYYKYDAKAGTDLNITLTAEESDGEFFGDTTSVCYCAHICFNIDLFVIEMAIVQ